MINFETMKKQQYDLVLNKLRAGEVVAIPTETVYGLAVDALNHEAIQKLYQIKNRNFLKPTSIAIKNPKDITIWAQCTTHDALKLVKKFWPGPLTLILPSNQKTPKGINLINDSIGVRCTCSPTVKKIITMLGNPICLTSANLSGNKEAVTAKQVRSELAMQCLY